MIKLIKLEYSKNRAVKYVKIALILTAVLALFIFAMTYLGIAVDPETGTVDTVEGTSVSSHVELLTTISFLVLAASMHASFTIDAFKTKTMDLMFSYPIQRKKVMASKILAVVLFSFTALVMSKLFIYVCLYFGQFFFTPDFPVTIDFLSPVFYGHLLLQSFTTACISIIALYAGLLMKSAKATVITSFLLIILMQGNIGSLSMANSVVLPAVLVVFSLLFAWLSVHRIEEKDVV